jgi:hypothetical protein
MCNAHAIPRPPGWPGHVIGSRNDCRATANARGRWQTGSYRQPVGCQPTDTATRLIPAADLMEVSGLARHRHQRPHRSAPAWGIDKAALHSGKAVHRTPPSDRGAADTRGCRRLSLLRRRHTARYRHDRRMPRGHGDAFRPGGCRRSSGGSLLRSPTADAQPIFIMRSAALNRSDAGFENVSRMLK